VADLTEIDTMYSDNSINTVDLGYTYYVSLKDANKIDLINSSRASSVELSTTPLTGEIKLNWNANVPWSNNTQGFPMHYIFRDHMTADPKEIILIDSVNVNQEGFKYSDTGQSNGEDLNENSIYCYYITTQGSYGNPKIQEPLLNNSQIICGQIEDNSPPCTPILSIEVTDCNQFISSNIGCSFDNYQNRLSWAFPDTNECIMEDFDTYNIYFSVNGRDPFQLIASLDAQEYTHSNLDSFAGCYYITAVDKNGNVSEQSSTLCNDNCPNYVLPNVFTPNDDGHNDVFNALNSSDNPDLDPEQCPLFVKEVLFMVYNRYGREIFVYNSGGENDILIGWDGTTTNNKELSSGVYYYSAEVLYDVINPEKQKKIFKGWVQILK
jgi:gliding motility-associated-like protein